jgi:hypothetical protein
MDPPHRQQASSTDFPAKKYLESVTKISQKEVLFPICAQVVPPRGMSPLPPDCQPGSSTQTVEGGDEGSSLGRTLGLPLGGVLGTLLGPTLGSLVGIMLGSLLGFPVGFVLGLRLGAGVGVGIVGTGGSQSPPV